MFDVLPPDLYVSIGLNWCDVLDFVALDTSLCNYALRSLFHGFIRSIKPYFQLSEAWSDMPSYYFRFWKILHKLQSISWALCRGFQFYSLCIDFKMLIECTELQYENFLRKLSGIKSNQLRFWPPCHSWSSQNRKHSMLMKRLLECCFNVPTLIGVESAFLTDRVVASLIRIPSFQPHTLEIARQGEKDEDLRWSPATLLAYVKAKGVHLTSLTFPACGSVCDKKVLQSVLAVLLHVPNLKNLDIAWESAEGNELSLQAHTIALFEAVVRHCPLIEEYKVWDHMRHAPATALEILGKGCKHMQHLPQLPRIDGDVCIPFLRHSTSITHIELEGVTCSDELFNMMADRCPRLKSFVLTFVAQEEGQLTDHGLLAVMRGCKEVEEVSLSYSPVFHNEMLAAISSHWPRLKSLSLQCNYTSDGALISIARGCLLLEEVRIFAAKSISTAGIAALTTNCALLHTLEITMCAAPLSNILPALALSTSLRRVHLEALRLERMVKSTDTNNSPPCNKIEEFVIRYDGEERDIGPLSSASFRRLVDCSPFLRVLHIHFCFNLWERDFVYLGRTARNLRLLKVSSCAFWKVYVHMFRYAFPKRCLIEWENDSESYYDLESDDESDFDSVDGEMISEGD